MRFPIFALLADVPLEYPRLKVAFLKWSYRQMPKFGFCPLPDSGKVKMLAKPANADLAANAELLLQAFHRDVCSGAIMQHKAISSYEKTKVLGNLDAAVVTALLAPKKDSDMDVYQVSIRAELIPLLHTMMEQLPGMCLPAAAAGNLPPWPLQQDDLHVENSATSSVEDATVKVLLPKVIRYDSAGRPLDTQDAVANEAVKVSETIDWKQWANASTTQELLRSNIARDGLHFGMLAFLQTRAQTEIPLELIRVSGRLTVVATREIPKGSLALTAVATDPNHLIMASMTSIVHPNAVQVKYSTTSTDGVTDSTVFWLSPDCNIPKPPKVVGESVEWSRNNSAWLFWALHRNHEEAKWNCELDHATCHLVACLGFNSEKLGQSTSPLNYTAEAQMPLIVNTRTIMSGEEVVLRCSPPVPQTKKTKIDTWQTVHASKNKKPTLAKADAKAKGAAK